MKMDQTGARVVQSALLRCALLRSLVLLYLMAAVNHAVADTAMHSNPYGESMHHTCSSGLVDKTACFLLKQHLKIKAYIGSPEDQFQLGKMYNTGYLGEVNRKTAVKWFTKSAEQSYLPAYVELGRLLESGFGGHQDHELALRYFRKAAEKNDRAGQYELARVHTEGMFLQVDYEYAALWLKQSAKHGYAPAQIMLAQFYRQGHGLDSNAEQSFYFYKQAAQQGYAAAQFFVADFLAQGHGVEKNISKARVWYERAAQNGLPQAQTTLADYYLNGQGVDKSPIDALFLLRKAADQEFHEAWYQLGNYFLGGGNSAAYEHSGETDESNDEKLQRAFYWFNKAAVHGNPLAATQVSQLQEQGVAVDEELFEQFETENKAWLGDVNAQLKLAKYFAQQNDASTLSRYWNERTESLKGDDASDSIVTHWFERLARL